jgi:hypothetical protein
MLTPWTREQKADFAAWHEAQLQCLNYPRDLYLRLVQDRTDWLTSIPLKRDGK